MDKTTIYLPHDLHCSLKALARRSGKPQAALIREAVEAYVANEAAEPPWPLTVGMFADLPANSDNFEEWLAENWDPLADDR